MSGVEFDRLKERFSGVSPSLFFDIDGTIKWKKTTEFPHGYNPKFGDVLGELVFRYGVGCGFCTSQSATELAGLLDTSVGFSNLFERSVSILEDGHVLLSFVDGQMEEKILVEQGVVQRIERLGVTIRECVSGGGDWGYLPGVATPVRIPDAKYQGRVIFNLWEQGPDMHSLEYGGEYELVSGFIQGLIGKLGFGELGLREAGNGTLSVVEKGRTKRSGLRYLCDAGEIDLDRVVYFGDGINDLEVAELVRSGGGVVIAVGNATPRLKEMANLVTNRFASEGLIEVLQEMI